MSKKTIKEKKTAVSVRDLHKLQEIARPSNAKLFYEDVEKEIEKEQRQH